MSPGRAAWIVDQLSWISWSLISINLAQLLYDQDKVYEGGRKGGNVRDYRYNFALQAVQELLQFALVAGHSDVESVDSVFHLFFLLLNDLRQGYGEACACA